MCYWTDYSKDQNKKQGFGTLFQILPAMPCIVFFGWMPYNGKNATGRN